jgi:hypothetical protein
MTAKKFASQADLDDKQITFSQISEHAWAYTAEGDPNTGVVLGASAYQPQQILASQDTYELIVERGEQDKASEIGRFPRRLPRERTLLSGDLVEFDATPYAVRRDALL